MNLKFLKANLFLKEQDEDNENYLIEFNIIYSDVYQLPTLYFIIYDLEQNNKLVSFEEFKTNLKNNRGYTNDFVSNNYEITQTVGN